MWCVCVWVSFFFSFLLKESGCPLFLDDFFSRQKIREIIEYFIEYLDKGRRGVLFFRDESNKSRLSL